MSNQAAHASVSAVLGAIEDALGEQLAAVYLYGSLSHGPYQLNQSDVNLLVVFEAGASIHEIRTVLRPVWQRYGPILLRLPVLGSISSIKRHLDLNPVLVNHLRSKGKLLAGASLVSGPIEYEPVESLARRARLAMRASAALAPSLLTEKEALDALAELRSLARQFFGKPIILEESAKEIVAKIQGHLSLEVQELPELAWEPCSKVEEPPLLEALQSIYEMENRLILLLPDMSPDKIADYIVATNWASVAEKVGSQRRGLQVTTPMQLRLMLQYDVAADFYLQSYSHVWGLDPLTDLEVSHWRVLRDLARQPSNILSTSMPHAYITTEDADLAMLVHDFQNRLLNIQLRNELLSRVNQRQVALPPDSLPDREAPANLRVEAVCKQLDWWAEYYTKALDSVKANLS